jgi:hypothetical protein
MAPFTQWAIAAAQARTVGDLALFDAVVALTRQSAKPPVCKSAAKPIPVEAPFGLMLFETLESATSSFGFTRLVLAVKCRALFGRFELMAHFPNIPPALPQ